MICASETALSVRSNAVSVSPTGRIASSPSDAER